MENSLSLLNDVSHPENEKGQLPVGIIAFGGSLLLGLIILLGVYLFVSPLEFGSWVRIAATPDAVYFSKSRVFGNTASLKAIPMAGKLHQFSEAVRLSGGSNPQSFAYTISEIEFDQSASKVRATTVRFYSDAGAQLYEQKLPNSPWQSVDSLPEDSPTRILAEKVR